MRISNPPDAEIDGITLRQIEPGDCSAWFDYLRVPTVFERTSWDLRSVDDLLPLVETYMGNSPTSPIRMAVVDESIGQLVGTIGLHSISRVNRSAEIAYDFSPSHWGRGLASGLCEAVTAWSFQTLDLHRLQATVLVGNKPSERVLGRCGFRHEGLLRGFRMVRGVPGDFNIFSRLSTDRAAESANQ